MSHKTLWAAVLLLASLLLAACQPVTDTSSTPVRLENGVVGTLRQPEGLQSGQKAPVVLMLHGFGSSKDEVGNMYARAADALAAKGIGSLRIDFQGFGKSDGDTGSTTIDGQVADAELAYNYLQGVNWVDPARMGVLGFSLGGGDAMILAGNHPDWFQSMVTWSSVGDMPADMEGSVGAEGVATANEKGVVGLDLGWRTIVLKKAFFDSMLPYDLPGMTAKVAEYPGAYLAIAGDQDFSAAYAQGLVDASAADPKEAWIVPGGDHIYQTLTEDLTMSDSVITRTADWFAQTLAAE